MAYGLKYYHQYNDRGDYLHRIEILGKDFGGTAELITTSTGDPIITRHSGDKAKKKIIQGKELQFSFFCFPGDVNKYDEIFESDYKDYKIRYYEDSQLKFEGWLMPENLSREYFKDQYIINLSATDGLARLRDVDFRDDSDKIIEGKLSLLEIIKYALVKLEIEFDFRIQLGTYEKDWMVASECALDKIVADARRFISKDGNPLKCYEVIENCLKTFSCTLKQQDGYYQITNKHEANSYQFVFDWTSLTQQSRTATNKIVDLAGYFYEKADLNKIPPLKDIGITFRNRSLGTTISTDNLDDWAGSWDHTFDTMSESGGEVKLNSGATWEGDYVELKNDFAVTKDTDYDYIQVSFDHDVERIVIAHCWPGMRVLIKKPPNGLYSESPWIPCDVNWKHYDSSIPTLLAQFRVYEAGNYNIRIIFNRYAGIDYGTYDFFLKNVKITKVVNTNVTDPVVVPLIAMDEYYIQTLSKNVIKLEYETLLADGLQGNQIGSFFYNNSGTYENTSLWNSYGHTENIPILDIWARNELNDRYAYKNYLRVVVHDIDNTINMDSILLIDSKHYTIVSYSRNEKKCIVTCDIIELLTTYQSYDQIYNYYLGSVDDVGMSSPPVESSQEHNELPGLQGGSPDQYYHFFETEYTELHNWLNNVVLSDIGGIDMDDVLLTDTINEHGAGVGVTIEGVKIEDSTLVTAAANMSFTDGTTGPHTLSDLIASAGYWSRTGTVLSPENAGDTIKISAASNQIEIEDSDDSRNWYISANAGILLIYDVDNTCYPFVLGTNTQSELFKIHSDQVKVENTIDSYASQVFYISQNPVTTQASESTVYVRGETSASVFQLVQEGTGNIAYLQDSNTPRFIFTQAGVLQVDTIDEITGAAGVTVDSVLLKDGDIGESTDYQGSAYLTSWLLRANTHVSTYVYPYSNTDSVCWQDYTYRYGGTIGSPAAAPTGAYISHKRSFVHDGGANREVLRFSAQIDGAVASDNVAGRWLWLLRPSGVSAALAIKMILDEAGLKLNVGSLALPSGASVDNIETTLTDDDTHLPTSGAVVDAIAGASPAAHTHGNITNAGAIGSTTNLPIITTTSGVLTVGSFGTGANTFCQGNDARLSDARTPTAHASSHHIGGSDLVNHDSLTGFVTAEHINWGITGGENIHTDRIQVAAVTQHEGSINHNNLSNTHNLTTDINHDTLTGFVGNEHINHTGVSMGTAATSGLNGGGTIAATRALVLAVERLTAVTTLQTTDYFPFYDASGSGTRRISYANMITELNGDLSFGSSDITMDGSTANGIITYGGADNIDVEANLTFDGSILTVTGDIDCTRFTTEAYGLRMIGSDAGDTNLSYIGFYASDGTTRQGYIGIASSGNDDLYVYAQTGDLQLTSVTGSIITTGNIYPAADGTDNLGSSTYRYSEIHADHYILDSETVDVDDTATGFIRNCGSDHNGAIGDALALQDDGDFAAATATTTANMPCSALALETGTGTIKVLLVGIIRNDGWNWTPGGEIYVSTTEAELTQTAPSGSGNCVQVVGIATHADEIYFNPDLSYNVV